MTKGRPPGKRELRKEGERRRSMRRQLINGEAQEICSKIVEL